MGARQRAQARGKRANGGPRGPPWASGQASPSVKASAPFTKQRGHVRDWQDISDSGSPHAGNGLFSMSQEARNTERHTMGWGPTRLREKAISFVSAGTLVRNDPATTQEEEDAEKETDGEPGVHTPEQDSADPESAEPIEDPTVHASREDHATPQVLQSAEFSAASRPLSRKNSASSYSSEEIVFCGRSNPVARPKARASTPKSAPIRPEQTIPIRPAKPESIPNVTVPASSDADNKATTSPHQVSARAGYPRGARPHNKPLNRHERARLRNKREREEEEALMRDYIENLAVDDDSDEDGDGGNEDGDAVNVGRSNEHHRFFDGSADANQKVHTTSSKTAIKAAVGQAIDWDSADLEDFDELSTTDEEVVEITQVLRRRVRPSGAQYLVTASGQDKNEARWVLQGKLKSASALKEIRIFEEICSMNIQEDTETSGTDNSDTESESDEALEDLVNEIESEDAENAQILKHTSRMSDEQIARALAKQEELGMGGDELVLFDGEFDDDDDDEIDDDFAADQDFIPFSTKAHLSNRGKSKRNRRQRDTFPPAEAFADALDQDPYGAFDIMDFDRPSLRPKKKGRKSDFPFDLGLDDEELAEHLRSTWSKDRDKKAARKRERQEAREAALLDASERNSPTAIKAEIRRFLIQETDSLALAPMDSATRASVHRLAKALRLKSRSEGKEGRGIGRYPVLTKGPQTPRFTIDTIWEIDALMDMKKFFPRHGGGSYRGPNAARGAGAMGARRGGGGAISGASYMNGEVVGGSAPELGADNKGRAILEKMGWTSGMGIGAVGNEGGLEAIKHVVKTTRAGLG
ncbi:hypothetical protein A1O1_00674 [Capronia coronata CBS 617.96]|uniref:G-patch domain-containing protein n=1 Tax=Capronia coronata CBS 617.96 TaxID=1182541 RepID=W9YRN1_9EURO|nr:uncharacterized protein A1O1_00674 [Capronia coronata CBS 617.96]EXJ95552.1 hypothetical protein A1O1_00674 [Capronia coronata CBS 617.96]